MGKCILSPIGRILRLVDFEQIYRITQRGIETLDGVAEGISYEGTTHEL